MFKDPIIEEIRKHRHEYAKRFNYDLRAICEDLKQKEKLHPDRIRRRPPEEPPKKDPE